MNLIMGAKAVGEWEGVYIALKSRGKRKKNCAAIDLQAGGLLSGRLMQYLYIAPNINPLRINRVIRKSGKRAYTRKAN